MDARTISPSQTPVDRLKARVHAIMAAAEESDRVSKLFDMGLMLVIVLNVLAVILETVQPLYLAHRQAFRGFELVTVTIFTAEYVLRLWSCTTDPRFSRPLAGRLRFALTPMALVDLVAILPFYLPLAFALDLRIVRVMRLFRLFRLLKMARYSKALQGMREVLRSRREELVLAFSFAMILLLIAASVLYFVEHEAQPEVFASIPDAMWWGIATLTTVGYGDIYPVTSLGRICGGIVAVVGVGLFALPAGILASGLSEHMERQRLSGQDDATDASRACPHCGKSLL